MTRSNLIFGYSVLDEGSVFMASQTLLHAQAGEASVLDSDVLDSEVLDSDVLDYDVLDYDVHGQDIPSSAANETNTATTSIDRSSLALANPNLSDIDMSQLTQSENLQQAFLLFNDLSQQLDQSYADLQQRVEHLSGELARVSAERLRELAEKEQLADRLQSLLHMLPAGVLLLDENGRVVDSNSAANDLLLKDYQSSFPESSDSKPVGLVGERWVHLIQACFQPRHDDGHEISLVNGRRVSLKTTAMMNERGQLILLTDMTETRHLQAQLSQHERLSAMGKMVASLAHQIRTPLAAATLYADHLNSQQLTEHHRQRFSGKLKERLRHLERQIQDMLIFARGDAPLDDQINLQQLLNQLQAAAEVPLQQYSAQCQWPEIPLQQQEALLRCNCDALISCVMNLINNALEACEANIQLNILLEVIDPDTSSHSDTGPENLPVKPPYIKLAIQDNGPGLTTSQQQKVMEPFFTDKTNGTGLGLAVVAAVVKAHAGVFSIQPSPAGGVSAEIVIPFNSSSDQEINHAKEMATGISTGMTKRITERTAERTITSVNAKSN